MNWCNQSWSKQPSCFCSDVTVQCKFPMEPFNTQGASYDHMYWLSISSASELTILRVQVFFAVQTQQKSHLNTTQFCLYLAIGDTTVSFNQITAIYMQWSSLYANLEVLTYLICKIQAADCACECQEIDAYNDTNKQTDCKIGYHPRLFQIWRMFWREEEASVAESLYPVCGMKYVTKLHGYHNQFCARQIQPR